MRKSQRMDYYKSKQRCVCKFNCHDSIAAGIPQTPGGKNKTGLIGKTTDTHHNNKFKSANKQRLKDKVMLLNITSR